MTDVRYNPATAGDRKNLGWTPGEALGTVIAVATGVMIPIRQRTNDRFFPHAAVLGTSSALGNGTLRVAPFVLPNDLNISHLGVEVVTAGEVGSTFRVGIYEDSTAFAGYPGALLIEAAAAADGFSSTVQELVCAVNLDGGKLYWIGGAVQNAPTLQPTLRTFNNPLVAGLATTAAPTASSQNLGYSQTGVSGALPATFSASVASAGLLARLHLRLA